MTVIQKLDPLLINQIAAGEVIDRPASVLKELLENAVDAGSTKVTVILEQGGKKRIQVHDNGDGIRAEELPLAIEPHATSKIRNMDDLQHVASFGFRGEALASISSISKFILTSKTAQDDIGSRLTVIGKDSKITQTPFSHPKGTSIDLQDLFFNVPVRQKFLKQDRTEHLYCEEVFKRIALANPHVAFELKDAAESKLFYPAHMGETAKQLRVQKVLSKRFMDNASSVSLSEHDIHIEGFVSQPEYSRSQIDQQYIFLNGRFIKDKLINHAVRQAYADLLDPGRYPAFVLYIVIDPEEVDVNVHPQKTEVRFKNPRVIHDLLIVRLRSLWQPEENNSTEQESEKDFQDYLFSKKPAQQREFKIPAVVKNESKEDERYQTLQLDNMLYVIDLKRFYHDYYYNQLCDMKNFETKKLLFPVRAKASQKLVENLESIQKNILNHFSVTIDAISNQEVMLRSIPVLPFSLKEAAFLESLLEILEEGSKAHDRIEVCFLNNLLISYDMYDIHHLKKLLRGNSNLPAIKIDLSTFEVV